MNRLNYCCLIYLFITIYSVNAQNVGISDESIDPDPSAVLEVKSTSKGLLIPRMTTAERDAISSPANTLLIFNSTTKCFEWWDDDINEWTCFGCACPRPGTNIAESATNTLHAEFTANWRTNTNATHYELDVATDAGFTTFVPGYEKLNVSDVSTYPVTGLSCDIDYYYRVRVCNHCGCGSSSNVIQQATPSCVLSSGCLAYGGPSRELCYDVVEANDGGFVMCGLTESFGQGSMDAYIVKTSNYGSIEWTTVIGGTAQDEAHSIIQTADGGYVVSGFTHSYGAGSSDGYIVKLENTGALQWTRTVGGTGSDIGYSIIQSSDGGYAIAGYTNSYPGGNYDAYIIKLDNTGDIQWTRTAGGSDSEYGYSIIETTDGSYVIGGETNSFGSGNFDLYLVKLLSDGTTCSSNCSSGSGGTASTGGTAATGGTGGTGGTAGTGGVLSTGGTYTVICAD